MKELSIEEKAKRYDEAIKRANELNYVSDKDSLQRKTVEHIFPELKESEDERISNEIIQFLQLPHPQFVGKRHQEEWITWLEKQGTPAKLSEEEQNKFAKGVLTSCALSFIDYLDAHKYEDKMCVSNGECEDIENAFHNAMWDRLHRYYCKYIEKQGKQEQLYIRFGEIPTDEKSKIYQGEIEVGTENGVSVYPAFKTSEGDIVLGLSLPITKTTLYTQQHLIEYDNRPCYLVKGDYVGKDTDGQPLINNVSIIEKIGTYRVREKKQDEQNLANSAKTCKVEQNPAWSEEDDKILKSIIINIENLQFSEDMREKYHHILNANKSYYQIKIDWLESLKDRVQPQPKNEWSGGDEAHLHSLITHLEQWIERHPNTTGADIQGENVAWLKSLKLKLKD